MSRTRFETAEESDLAAVQQLAREFAEREIRPLVMKYDELQEFPEELIAPLGALGFLGAMVPEEYDGAGLTPLQFTCLVEELSRIDPSLGLTICAHNGLCVNHLLMFSSAEQRRKYIPPLSTGRKLGAWALTEPGSGSDAAGMRSTAVYDGEAWELNGSKIFITNASVASTFVVMAVTGSYDGRNTISAFILEKGMPGFSVGRKENKLGMRSSDTAMLIFENVRVPPSNMIGTEGDGFRQAMSVLDSGRFGIAALSVGLAQGAYEASLKYALERRQFGHQISEFQGIQWKLADMATQIAAARLLTRHAAMLKEAGEKVTLAGAEAKLFASEVAVKVANEAVQIHGGYGYMKDYPVEKFYRDAKLLTIGEGTSEVQRMVIAKQLLRQ